MNRHRRNPTNCGVVIAMAVAIMMTGARAQAQETGINVGGFTLRGTQELVGTYTRYGDSSSDFSARLDSEASAQSNWARHELRFETSLSSTVPRPASGKLIDEMSATLTGRLDISEQTILEISTTASRSYDNDPDSDRGSDVSVPGSDDSYGASARLSHTFGVVGVEVEGGVSREEFGAQQLAGGATEIRSDQNRWVYNGRARVRYAGGGRLQPFIEGRYQLSAPDALADSNGVNRRWRGISGLLGVAYGGDEDPLSAEIAGGYGRAMFDEPTYSNASVWLAEASIRWAPTERQAVTARVATSFDLSDDPAVSTVISRSAAIGVEQALGARIEAGAEIEAELETYQGSSRRDTVVTVSGDIAYLFTDRISALLRSSYIRRYSNESSNRDSQFEVGAGVRIRY